MANHVEKWMPVTSFRKQKEIRTKGECSISFYKGNGGKKTTSKSFVNSPNPSLGRPNQYSHQFLVTHVRLAGFTNKCAEYIAKGLIVDNFFPENMIDEEACMLLDEASLKEMVPAVGPRKKFMKKLEEEKVF